MLGSSRGLLLKLLFFFENSFFMFFRKVFCRPVKCLKVASCFNLYATTNSVSLFPTLCFLKYHSNCRFRVLMDLTCFDFIGKKKRFCLNYNLLSYKYHVRFFLRVNVSTLSTVL